MRILVPATALALCMAFILWIDHPIVRYSHASRAFDCSVPQLLNLPQHIDFIALGSSRMREGIDMEVLAKESDGTLKAAYNLGRSGRDMIRSYAILRDLDERGIHPKIVFVELDLESLRGTESRSDLQILDRARYAGFLRYSDILDIPHTLSMPPVYAYSMALAFLKAKLEWSIVRHLTGDISASIRDMNQPSQSSCIEYPYTIFPNMTAHKIARIKKQLSQIEKDKRERISTIQKTFGDPSHALDDRFNYQPTTINQIELRYLNKIRSITSRYGMKLYVSRHWAYADPPLSDRVLAQIRTLVPEFIYPPHEILRNSAQSFVDTTHMGSQARNDYSRWLASTIHAQVQ